MKKLAILLTMASMAIGCGRESNPGGPGASRPGTGANGAANGASDRTFTITVPGIAEGVRQGEEGEVTIKVHRGDQFKEPVTLTFEAPAGVQIEPRTVEVKEGQDEQRVKVRADATAQVGKHTVTVKATPQTGVAVTQTFDVNVREADRAADRDVPRTPERPTVPETRPPAGQPPSTEPAPQPATQP